jgi:hypothetical protein
MSTQQRFGVENAYHLGLGSDTDELLRNITSDKKTKRFLLDRWSDEYTCDISGLVPGDGIQKNAVLDRPDLYRLRCFDPECSEASGAATHTEANERIYFVANPPVDLRMYTLIPRICGPIRGWVDQLDRIEGMGFNALQLLPITEMGPSASPYAISDHFAIDPSYGDGNPAELLESFDAFIEECARRSLRVCVDLALNHFAVDGKATVAHRDWLEEDASEPDGIRRAGWSDGETWYTWRDLALLDFSPFSGKAQDELEAYLDRYAIFWAERAGATNGLIRLDNLHSSNQPYMSRLLKTLRRKFPNVLILGELFGDERMIVQTANSMGVNLLLGTPWEHKFVPELRSYLQYVHRMYDRLHFHFPVSSHDSGTIVEEFGSPLATAPRLVVSTLLGSGSTGMVQGIEYGAETKIEFIGPVTDYSVIGNSDFSALVSALNSLHAADPIFRRAGNVLFIDRQHVAIIAGLRIDPATGKPGYLVVVNFDTVHPQTIVLPPPPGNGAKLEDTLSDNEISWIGELVEVTLHPGDVAVYRIVGA